MRAVVLFKDGYDEIEALGAVDILTKFSKNSPASIGGEMNCLFINDKCINMMKYSTLCAIIYV